MISAIDLKKIARARLKDAEILFSKKRYDGAVYLCGYAVELFLKSRICRTIKWEGYPSLPKEFNNFTSFRTHNLDVLLKLSGIEYKIKDNYFLDWSIVATWDPTVRYKPIGTNKKTDALNMIESTRKLSGVL